VGKRASEGPETNAANIKITSRDQVTGDSAIDTVIRQLQRRCNELKSSLTLASNAPTVSPALQRHLGVTEASPRRIGQHICGRSLGRTRASSIPHTYEEYEINLVKNRFLCLLSTRFVRLAQKIVCSSHQIYMT